MQIETTLEQMVTTLELPTRSETQTTRDRPARFTLNRNDDEPLLEPRAAAVELLAEFKRIAGALSPRDACTQDDLVQEMCLATLSCPQAHKRTYYKWLAGWRAKDYLRWWLSPMKRYAEQALEAELNDANATAS